MTKRSIRCRTASLAALMGVLASPIMALAQTSPAPPVSVATLQRQAPAGAPNIVVILLDDVGFGAASTFGGPVQTPNLDALAREGLRYNRFHTTAMCSPTRAALLTGRNAHAVGIGGVMTDDRPGYTGFQTAAAATIAEVLRENGYGTAAFGKWHQTASWELSQSGPFDRWPTGEGFERFYGFQGGGTDQYNPELFEGTTPVLRPDRPDYHLTEDLADQSIAWIRAQKSVAPDKPFFLYFAPGATHAPLQVPAKWIEPYRGKFDKGWDAMREDIFARQKRSGIIPPGTQPTSRPPGMPAWNTLGPDEKRVATRLMETYAGFLAQTDAEVGRVIGALKDSGKFENTLILYIVGDNGASAEGGLNGTLHELGSLLGSPEPTALKVAHLDEVGTAKAHAHFNAEWAWALNSPFQWTKTVASHLGGTRNGLVVSWPGHIAKPGGLRSQFGHVTDIVPTILEAVGLQMPASVNGVDQLPLAGTSLLYSFNAPAAPERHLTQYFEIFGHRAIYHDGWMASAFHDRLPWGAALTIGKKSFDEDRWELYDLRRDFSQSRDLASKEPAKLKELQELFLAEAERNQVLPLKGQQTGPNKLPSLGRGIKVRTFYPGAVRVPTDALPSTTNTSWRVTSDIDVTDTARGVVAKLGSRSMGWVLYLDTDNRPTFAYKLYDLKTVVLKAAAPLAAGKAKLRVDFDYDGKGFSRGGKFTLFVNDKAVGSDTVPSTPPFLIGGAFDVGIDMGSPPVDYPAGTPLGFALKGAILDQVVIETR